MAAALGQYEGIPGDRPRRVPCRRNRAPQNQSGPSSLPRSRPPGADGPITLTIFDRVAHVMCQHAAKSVNHVAIVAVDHVAVGRLHFEAFGSGPGAAAQNSPVPSGPTASAFVSVGAPFPNVSAEIVQA